MRIETDVKKEVSRKKGPKKNVSNRGKDVKNNDYDENVESYVQNKGKKPMLKGIFSRIKNIFSKIKRIFLRKSSKNKPSSKKKTVSEKTAKKTVKKNINRKIFNKKSKKKFSKNKLSNKLKNKKEESLFIKDKNNPLISPNPKNGWEAGQTFNPTAIRLDDGKVHFLYRAVGKDGMSRLGYASSKDCSNILERDLKPAYEHLKVKGKFSYYSFVSGGSWGGCEDPRVVRVGDEDRLFLLYTACDEGLRVGLSSISVEDFLNKKWKKWSKPKLISPEGEVHKNWVLFPEKINGKYAILHSINPDISIEYLDSMDFKEGEYIRSEFKQKEVKKGRWDSKRRGVGPIPIRTKDGWLVFYHAEDHRDPGKYKVGAMLLDLENPEKVLYRSKVPILEPKEYYEMEGAKGGVVYTLGSVVREDGRLFVFYGGADNYVCVASADLEEFLEAIKKGERKPLKFLGFLKRKKKGKKKKIRKK